MCVEFFSYVVNSHTEIVVRKKIVEELIEKNKLDLVEFYNFSPNPKIEDVEIGIQELSAYGCDVIIAIGGGSVIDMAKLIRFKSHSIIPLVVIPATAGTGAESTQFAVCYENGVKMSFDSPSILPDYVLLCPELTSHNNEYLTACTGFDALAQAIEAYWNINATDESDELALQAIANICKLLLITNKSANERATLLQSANLAGRAINITRTTAPHAMSYVFTSKYGYPHGHAVALTFPYFFEKNLTCPKEDYKGADYKHYKAKMEQLKKVLDITKGQDLFEWMKLYTKAIGLGYDSQKPFVDEIVAKCINLQRAKNNPMRLTEDIIKEAVLSIRL